MTLTKLEEKARKGLGRDQVRGMCKHNDAIGNGQLHSRIGITTYSKDRDDFTLMFCLSDTRILGLILLYFVVLSPVSQPWCCL